MSPNHVIPIRSLIHAEREFKAKNEKYIDIREHKRSIVWIKEASKGKY